MNIFANHVAMNTIQKLVIQITESLLEQLLKISRKIGYVQSAEWVKKYL